MSNRSDRLAARFADLAQPVGELATVRPQEDAPAASGDPNTGQIKTTTAGWDATHRRVTYWMHLDVIDAVRKTAKCNGESVAAFVDRALRTELRRASKD